MASVTELAGRFSVPLTAKLEMLASVKVLVPVKVWLLAKYAKEVVPVNWFTERPVTVAPVKLSEEETVSAPMVLVLDMIPPQALSCPLIYSPPTTSNFASLEVTLPPITMA